MQVTTTINGQTYTLTYNSSSGAYEATLNAPQGSSYNLAGGYYPVSVSATDDAGNTATADSNHSTLGSSLRLVVKEKVVPSRPLAERGIFIIPTKIPITAAIAKGAMP